jgi:hypothetical protein
VWGEGCNDPFHNTTNRPQLYLVRLTAHEAAVLRLGLAAGGPHFTPHERATSIVLEQKLTQAQPIGGRS